jgi:hypothetical protein
VAAVVVVDLPGASAARIGPMLHSALATGRDDQDIHPNAGAVIDRHREEVAELLGLGKPEHLGEEGCRLLAIPSGHDGVVERDGHVN